MRLLNRGEQFEFRLWWRTYAGECGWSGGEPRNDHALHIFAASLKQTKPFAKELTESEQLALANEIRRSLSAKKVGYKVHVVTK
jgi:hypothetical protein